MIIYLIVERIKNISLYKMSYFSVPYTCNKNKIKLELDLSNNATKSDLKYVTDVDTSDFAKKADLESLNTTVDKSDKVETCFYWFKRIKWCSRKKFELVRSHYL